LQNINALKKWEDFKHEHQFFRVAFKRHNGNLHVHPGGDFDGSSAFQLIRLLNQKILKRKTAE